MNTKKLSEINQEIDAIANELKTQKLTQSFKSVMNQSTQPLGIREPSELAADTINVMSLNGYSAESILEELRHLHSHGKVYENLDSMLLTQAIVLNRLFHHSISSNQVDTAVKASQACQKAIHGLKVSQKPKMQPPRFCETNYINKHGQRVTEYYDKDGDLVTIIE